jgi:hypothetical protein
MLLPPLDLLAKPPRNFGAPVASKRLEFGATLAGRFRRSGRSRPNVVRRSIFLILKSSQFCQKGQQRFGSVAFPEQDPDRREQDNAFRESAYLPTVRTHNARNREH